MAGALANEIEICNLALTGMLGKPGITSFTQASTEAQRCAQFYPIARDEVAQASHWTFLRERAALAETTNDQSESWDVAYDVPVRALKLFYLYEPSRPEHPVKKYRQIGGKIYTNLSPAHVAYVTLEDKPISSWTLHFKQAIAARVAGFLAPSMTRRTADVDAMRALAGQHLAVAIENDASTEYTSYTEDESYIYGIEGGSPYVGSTYDGSTFWR